ncbi:hypothetical protein BDK51DRAFT_37816 [Blyttiomyces helicus]|uniref:Uncharacterized protein n=1 Tax=Blyttiomyces helicus TaxID=388810 RepID=A0A4P9W4U7_9FUNG|nr:hypothetical protein BDK51DRAFT_37816 [Blyttiomyces helicus]|eukprot:RKO86295.1 hypothetical protein BDK51DRAFT_37816 [Blyttiomyces helicus]
MEAAGGLVGAPRNGVAGESCPSSSPPSHDDESTTADSWDLETPATTLVENVAFCAGSGSVLMEGGGPTSRRGESRFDPSLMVPPVGEVRKPIISTPDVATTTSPAPREEGDITDRGARLCGPDVGDRWEGEMIGVQGVVGLIPKPTFHRLKDYARLTASSFFSRHLPPLAGPPDTCLPTPQSSRDAREATRRFHSSSMRTDSADPALTLRWGVVPREATG